MLDDLICTIFMFAIIATGWFIAVYMGAPGYV